MFKLKKEKEMQEVNTIVGLDTVFQGEIKCRGSIRVDGNVNGDITVDGDIYVGDSAKITGNITANTITIGGIVEGNVTTLGILRLLSTAKLTGDIKVNGIIADEGGIFMGKCHMSKPPKRVLEGMFLDKRNKETKSDTKEQVTVKNK